MFRWLKVALLALAGVTAQMPALAQDQPALARRVVVVNPLVTARTLIERGDTGAAESILDAIDQLPEAERTRFDAVEIQFLRGRIAFAEGRLDDAAGIYRGLLRDRPGLTRVRLELGRTLFSEKRDRTARRQFERALSGDDLPNSAIDNIERFLAVIEDRKTFSLRFALSLVPDSNINQATDGQTVDIFGLPFVLNDEAVETSGVGVFGSAGIEYRPRLSERSRLLATFNAQRTEFDGAEFDDTVIAGSLGAELRLGRHQLRAEATAFRRWFGTPGFNRGAGGRVTLARRLTRRVYLQIAVAGQYVDYDLTPARDGPVLIAQFSPLWVPDPATRVSAILGLSREFARVDFQRSTGLRLGLGLDRDLPWGLTVTARPEVNWRKFDALQAAFGKTREDVIVDFSLDLIKRDLPVFGLVPFLGYTVTHNASNIGFFVFTRHRFRFGLQQRF